MKKTGRNAIRQRSAWLASMFGCAAFLVMAVKIYHVSLGELWGNLLTALLVLGIILASAATLVWLLAAIRRWRK